MTTVNLNLIPVDETQLVLAAGDDTQLVLSAGDETQIVLSSVAISNGLMMTDGSNSALALGSAGTPSLKFAGDANTGIFSPGADQLSVTTGGTERLRIDGAGQIEAVSLGSAAAPTFSFTGDPNTGIYSPGADQLAISTAGTGRLFVASGGNVGIGTSSPGSLLNLAHPTAADIRLTVGSTLQANIYSSSSDTNIFSVANNPLILGTNNTERLRVTSTGLVGIGTSSPSQLLHVNGNTFVGAAAAAQWSVLTVAGDAALAAAAPIFHFVNAAGSARFAYINHSGTGGDLLVLNQEAGALRLGTSNQERLRITSAGLVGIGTTTVQAGHTLQVNGIIASVTSFGAFTALQAAGGTGFRWALANDGTFRLQRTTDGFASAVTTPMMIDASSRVGIGTTSPAVPLEVSGVSAQIRVIDSAVDMRLLPLAGSSVGIVGTVSNHALSLFTNNAERARIDSSGRLLVGTSASTNFIGTAQPAFLQLKEDANNFALGLQRASNDSAPPNIAFRKTRATTDGGVTVVADGDTLGQIRFIGTDGTGAIQAATIRVDVDGTPGTNDMPGRVVFSTTADGAAIPIERMRIKSTGIVNIANTPTYADNAAATAGGLVAGDIYRTSTGQLMIRY